MSKPLTALGLMSGTSMDGIDVALLETDGDTVHAFGPASTYAYSEEQRTILRQANTDAAILTDRLARPGSLPTAEDLITKWHVEAVHKFLAEHGVSDGKVDVIGFHGQTVIHRPDLGFTVQLGDGARLASQCKIPVVYDMRANDMRHGGQGAPLVPVYHRALVNALKERPVAILNIGGVANVTWIGSDGELVAFDTGPGNALIDDWMKQQAALPRDEGGRHARQGKADPSTVAQFLGDSFFEQRAPKSLDRNTFAGYRLDGLSVNDGAATLVAVTAEAVAASVRHMPAEPKTWIVCGGGRHNRAIMEALEKHLPSVISAEHLKLDGDAIEAQAWAFLAVRALNGLPLTFPGTTGVEPPVSGGVIVRP